MAEVSEAMYAAASAVSSLPPNPSANQFYETYKKVVGDPENPDRENKWGTLGVVQGNLDLFKKDIEEREWGAAKKRIEKSFDNLAQGWSAVLATRRFIAKQVGGMGPPDEIFITGNTWPEPVQKYMLAADQMGMKDYNSSDVILRYGNTYYGISLKVANTANAGQPTMINMSFANLLKGDEGWVTTLTNKINVARRKHFAQVIKGACQDEKLLGSVCATEFMQERVGGQKSISELDPNNEADARRIWDIKVPRIKATYAGLNLEKGPSSTKTKDVPWTYAQLKQKKHIEEIPFINLKGVNELWQGINTQLGAGAKEAFRKHVNKSLYSDGKSHVLNPLFQEFLDVMNDANVADKVADQILDRTLKLSLLDNVGADFDFLLVRGNGNADNFKIPDPEGTTPTEKEGYKPKIDAGEVHDIHSIMIAGLMLKRKPSSIVMDTKRTFTGRGTASVAFTVLKGKLPVLNVTLRYKGSFAAMPSFLATMTNEFKAYLNNNKGKKELEKMI